MALEVRCAAAAATGEGTGGERAATRARVRSSGSNQSGRGGVPEWWGLHVDGALVQVIRWPEATRPTLADFNVAVPTGVEYEIAPLHVSAGD
jgi:hypothetical protein